MIDITVNLTIDQEHEDDFEQIMKHITTIPGMAKVDVKTETYFEYNIDSTPHWRVEFEEISTEEFRRRLNLWEEGKYNGNDYLLCNTEDNSYVAVDNASGGEFFVEEFKTREEAINWINGEELEDDHYDYCNEED